MSKTFELTREQVDFYKAKESEEYKKRYMTAKEVEEKYKISMSRQTQLIKAGRVIVVTDAQRVLYPRDFAEWWFSQYVAAQQGRISTKVAKGTPKAGRPKKPKGEYTYKLWGIEYTDGRPVNEVEYEWKCKIANYYPHLFEDLTKPQLLLHVMQNQDQYPDYVNQVKPAFDQLRKVFAKLLTKDMK